MAKNKRDAKKPKKSGNAFPSKNIKHNPQDESSRAKSAPGSSSDGERHTNSR